MAFLGITIIALAVLPFFLPSSGEAQFSTWLSGRSAIVLLGLVTGLGYSQFVGVVVPEFMAYLPLAMATAAGFGSCYLMYSNLFRFQYVD